MDYVPSMHKSIHLGSISSLCDMARLHLYVHMYRRAYSVSNRIDHTGVTDRLSLQRGLKLGCHHILTLQIVQWYLIPK